MTNNKPNVKLKTIQFNIQKKHNKILDYMTTISRNIFNCCIFTNNFFTLYLNKSYQQLYHFLKHVKKSTLSEFGKNKIIKNNNINLILGYLKEYYIDYTKNHKLMIKNNNIIFDYIKNKIKGIILNSSNIKQIQDDIINELSNLVEYDTNNKNIVFTNIIERILKSFYDKIYFLTKYQLLHNISFTFKDTILENDIKNNNYYFDNIKYVNYKKKIQKRFNSELLSNQYIFKKFVYENCLGNNKDKLPADITLNLIDKYSEAINSYYGKISKKLKANKPKYLDKNQNLICFIFNRHLK
jgi:hypothetical protein